MPTDLVPGASAGRMHVIRTVGLAYLAHICVMLILVTLIKQAWGYGLGSPVRLLRALPAMAWFYGLFFSAGLVITTPIWLFLWLARHRIGAVAGGVLGAVVLLAWGEWSTYRMEWFDVWRHGDPGLRYWTTTILPTGVAWAAAGAVLGSRTVRARR